MDMDMDICKYIYSNMHTFISMKLGVNGRPMHPEGVLQLLLGGMGLLQTMPLIVTLTVDKVCVQVYIYLIG
jgi:hypothetical protein